MSEKLKTIDIKGKEYVQVHTRIDYFNKTYPNGRIITELLSNPSDVIVLFKAIVTPDIEKMERYFTGYSQAKWGDGYINKSSAVENAETSAVGRALGMMGIGITDAFASVDEIDKAQSQELKEEDFLVVTKQDEAKKHINDIKVLVNRFSKEKEVQERLKKFIIFNYAPIDFEGDKISDLPIDILSLIVTKFETIKQSFEQAEKNK